MAAVFAVISYYHERPAELPPLTIDGKPNYNMGPVKFATVAAMVWGIAGMAVGLWIALELAYPALNLDLPWIAFGRLRPLHTSAVIFAFGGNVLIATSFYVVQRTCRARLAGNIAPWFVVLGYNLFIVIAGTGYLLGITQSKEYAEPEWYADLWLTIVWVTYLLVYLGTIIRRNEPHIYVANWFYLAFILTIAVLHLTNNAAIPVSLYLAEVLHRLGRRAGRHGAMVVRPQRGRASSSPRVSSASSTTSFRSAPSGRSTATGSRSSTSGR